MGAALAIPEFIKGSGDVEEIELHHPQHAAELFAMPEDARGLGAPTRKIHPHFSRPAELAAQRAVGVFHFCIHALPDLPVLGVRRMRRHFGR